MLTGIAARCPPANRRAQPDRAARTDAPRARHRLHPARLRLRHLRHRRRDPLRFGDAPSGGIATRRGSTIGGTGIAISSRCDPDDALLDHLAGLLDPEYAAHEFIPADAGQPSLRSAWTRRCRQRAPRATSTAAPSPRSRSRGCGRGSPATSRFQAAASAIAAGGHPRRTARARARTTSTTSSTAWRRSPKGASDDPRRRIENVAARHRRCDRHDHPRTARRSSTRSRRRCPMRSSRSSSRRTTTTPSASSSSPAPGERAFCAGSDIRTLDKYATPWDFRNRTDYCDAIRARPQAGHRRRQRLRLRRRPRDGAHLRHPPRIDDGDVSRRPRSSSAGSAEAGMSTFLAHSIGPSNAAAHAHDR